MGANSFLYGGQLVLAPRFRGQLGIPLLVFYISLGYSIGNSYPIKLLGGRWFRNTQQPPLTLSRADQQGPPGSVAGLYDCHLAGGYYSYSATEVTHFCVLS